MSDNTINYGLVKPLTTEYYDVEIQNENMNIIDQKLGEAATMITGIKRMQPKLVTADKVISAADSEYYQNCVSAGTINIIIPNEETIPLFSVFPITREGSGPVKIIPQDGVSLKPLDKRSIKEQYMWANLIKIGSKEWRLFGALE
jgi:hypothetical protein